MKGDPSIRRSLIASAGLVLAFTLSTYGFIFTTQVDSARAQQLLDTTPQLLFFLS